MLSETISLSETVPKAPEDPLYRVKRQFSEDEFPGKIDLGIGAYRDDAGRPWVLPVVKKTEKALQLDPCWNHEYLPISGSESFVQAAAELLFGISSPALREKRTVSGTGAVSLGARLIAKASQAERPVILSVPTWPNHEQIFTQAGMRTQPYSYLNVATMQLNMEGLLSDLRGAPMQSVVVLQVCAHNPTGIDPSQDDWKQIAAVMSERQHFPFFDCAYQGFASGSLERDSWVIRHFVDEGFELCVAQSFSKNLGLYGQRVGAFHFVVPPRPDHLELRDTIRSQLSVLQRAQISTPPAYGAKIAAHIFEDAVLLEEWRQELSQMSERLIDVRQSVRAQLETQGTPGDWSFLSTQIGMFSYTGLSKSQVCELRAKWHIYMTDDGRMSVAGLNGGNISYFVSALDDVVRRIPSPRP
ncbi:hypothetical protein G7054_g7728 [Neopestalotiopsis clavispora]|nr:hypothetical protein G7054_g7728 [Neopestalotiopsis clavispora]